MSRALLSGLSCNQTLPLLLLNCCDVQCAGKRRCLGDALARNCLFLFLTGMLQRYRLSAVPGEATPSSEPVPGLTLCPRPYRVLLTPRTACPGSPPSRCPGPSLFSPF